MSGLQDATKMPTISFVVFLCALIKASVACALHSKSDDCVNFSQMWEHLGMKKMSKIVATLCTFSWLF